MLTLCEIENEGKGDEGRRVPGAFVGGLEGFDELFELLLELLGLPRFIHVHTQPTQELLSIRRIKLHKGMTFQEPVSRL